MVGGYMLDNVLDKTNEIIGIEKFDTTNISVDTDYKSPDNATLINIVMSMTWVIKDDNKIYPRLFLEEASIKDW